MLRGQSAVSRWRISRASDALGKMAGSFTDFRSTRFSEDALLFAHGSWGASEGTRCSPPSQPHLCFFCVS